MFWFSATASRFCILSGNSGLPTAPLSRVVAQQRKQAPLPMASLIDYVKSEQIPYIYYIELSNQNVAKDDCPGNGNGFASVALLS